MPIPNKDPRALSSLKSRAKKTIYDCVLGDGSLSITSGSKNASFRYSQSKTLASIVNHISRDHRPLVMNLKHKLESMGLKIRIGQAKRASRGPESYIYTQSFPVITKWLNEWYSSGKKRVPRGSLSWIDVETVAQLVSDDGHLRRDRGLIISSNSFSKHDNRRLVERLNKLFNIKAQIIKGSSRGGWRISIHKSDYYERVAPKIHPWMHKVMYYKLPEQFRKEIK